MPEISVILPFHNTASFLENAIQSILDQSFKDLELICIDDGSTDESYHIARQCQMKDSRIKIIRQNKNYGISRSLNSAIKAANGKYIARMDADDISTSDRLHKQYKFLEKQPEVDLIGTQVNVINKRGRTWLQPEMYFRPDTLKYISMFTSPLVHPTIMGKKKIFDLFKYSEAKEHQFIEDYELWNRMLFNGIIATNLEDRLLYYRTHEKNTNQQSGGTQSMNAARLLKERMLHHFNLSLNDNESLIVRGKSPCNVKLVSVKLNEILHHFTSSQSIPHQSIKEALKFNDRILAEAAFKTLRTTHNGIYMLNALKLLISSSFGRKYFANNVKNFIIKKYFAFRV